MGYRCIQLDSSGVNSRHKPQLLLCYRNAFIPLAFELLLFFCGFQKDKTKGMGSQKIKLLQNGLCFYTYLKNNIEIIEIQIKLLFFFLLKFGWFAIFFVTFQYTYKLQFSMTFSLWFYLRKNIHIYTFFLYLSKRSGKFCCISFCLHRKHKGKYIFLFLL